ncbi:MAG: hypothetical protein HY821_16820 [Acidobacteria bacterium]|nr:hypothetical protein [Acidobacteriota bacterium]
MPVFLLALLASLAACRRSAPPPAADEPRTSLFIRDDPAIRARLLRGFEFAPDVTWSQRLFAVRLDRPSPVPDSPLYVELDFAIPDELRLGELAPDLTLAARVNGADACRETYRRHGRANLTCLVPAAALDQPSLTVEFETDRSFRDLMSGTNRSLVIAQVRIIPYEATAAFHAFQGRRARQAEALAVQEWDKYPQARRERLRQIMAPLPAWNSTRFLGIPVGRNPLDLWMLQQLIYEVRPEYVIAADSGEGGEALYLAQALRGVQPGGKVLAVGAGAPPAAASALALWKEMVEFIRDSPAQPAAATLAARAGGARTLVVLSAGPALGDLAGALARYSPLVSPGSYLIVEDTARNAVFGAVVRSFLASAAAAEFQPDRRRDAFLLSFNSGGWLRRNTAVEKELEP